MSNTVEKREYFRIDDQLMIHCVLEGTHVDESATEEPVETPEFKQLASLSGEISGLINAIYSEQQIIAKALGLMSQRQKLLERVIAGRMHVSTDYELVNANISGAGIAFKSAVAFEQGDRVRLSMIFQPSQLEVVIHGTIVECATSADAYQLRVDFDQDEFAREQIIQHVVQRQS